LGIKIHLLIPDWESGHSDLHPRQWAEHTVKKLLDLNPPTSAWPHDGGETLGSLGSRILGGHKLVPGTTSPLRLRVKVIDHHSNNITPWLRNTQLFPYRLRIIGDARTRAIDLHIPAYQGQTCLNAILLSLQIVGCDAHLQPGDTIGFAITSHTARTEPDQSESMPGDHNNTTDLQPNRPGLHLHSTLDLTDRLTMFLPPRVPPPTWGSACLGKDTEILLADGTFATLLQSIGQAIWTGKQETRRIKRIHKFDTLATDPHQYEVEGNWMTASHFTRFGEGKKWRRVSDVRGNILFNRRPPQDSVYAVELDTDDHLTLRGGLQAATFGNCLIVEPRRQGYTQDFHFNLEQALRNKNLLTTHIIEWHHAGIGHRADGSLILDTDRIKPPQKTDRKSTGVPVESPPRSKLETYRDCGRCRKPEAKLKCACLATHYCDTRCQREDMPDHRRECTHMILKDVHRIQHQLDKHRTSHGQFTIEVARLELVLTETHVKLADILRSSLLGRNQPASEDQYLQALQRISRLVKLTYIQERPSLLHNLKVDQVAAQLGLGSLYRDQQSLEKALVHLNEALALTEALISIKDSPGLQDKVGVILTTQGEILNSRAGHRTGLASQQDTQIALSKQKRAVQIFRQLEESITGPLRETTLRRLVDSLISLSDTLEFLDLYDESQAAMQEAQVIGEKARREDSNSPLHQHHSTHSCTKSTMNARKDLDDHTPTLHVGSKIRLYGLQNQSLNGKKGSVTGPARNNRIGIQLQEEQRRVSVRISNIRYWEDPELSCLILYERMVTKAHFEIATLRTEVKTQEEKLGKKSIHTAFARYNLGSALWLSFKPHETALAVQEFTLIIEFMTQREPTHPMLKATLKIRDIALKNIQNFENEGTLAAWPYWKSPSARWEDTKEMGNLFYELIAMTDREKELTITASTMKEGLHRYGLFGFCSPTPQLIDQATFITIACDEIAEMKLKCHNPLHTIPPQTTEHQSSPSSEGDDT